MAMGVAGFWSYSHDDNEHDGHAILRLATRIQAEFALVTGEALEAYSACCIEVQGNYS